MYTYSFLSQGKTYRASFHYLSGACESYIQGKVIPHFIWQWL